MDPKIGPARPVVVEANIEGRAIGGEIGAHHVVVRAGELHLHPLRRQVEIERGFELVGVGDDFDSMISRNFSTARLL